MPFSAIICATKPAGEAAGVLRSGLSFAGQTLVEYQARQAAEAGAGHVMIVVGAVTQALSRAVDRLTADGISVALIRDMVSLIREAPRSADVLLVADGLIVPQRYYAQMGNESGNALLVVEENAATTNLERLNAHSRWAGIARFAPELLFNTLDMIGDWDLELTLVRAAVQSGYKPVHANIEDVMEGRLALVSRQADADLVTEALLARPATPTGEAGAERYLLGPLANLLAPALLRAQVPAGQARMAAFAVGALGLITAFLAWPIIALILCLAGIALSLTADNLAALARRGGQDIWASLGVQAIVIVSLALVAVNADRMLDGLYLALSLAMSALALRAMGRTARWTWAMMTPGSACCLILLAALAGYVQAGFVAVICVAILSLGMALLAVADIEKR